VIGDVAGKGVAAAGMTETVRSMVRAFASIDPTPAFVLRKTGQLLLAEETDEHFYVTALLAIVDQASGDVQFGSAGHPGPVHLSGTSARVVDPRYGPPLGTFASEYTSAGLQLAPGESLVLYTDGVTEARRAGRIFGQARLVDSVRGLSGETPQSLAEGVAKAAGDFSSQLMDDLEVLVIRRL
jgi:phosphoserine phosphatase RsbU/P